MAYLVMVLNVVLLVAGQTLWKIGLNKLGGLRADTVLRVMLSPYILGGLVLYGIATVAWFYVLSKVPLSLAYPLQSLAYVLGMVVALAVFHEPIPLNRWVGVAIILVGVGVMARR